MEEQWHGGNREIGVVIDGRIRTRYVCFTYTPVSTVSFVLVKANFKSVSEVPKFRVNSLSIVYHCAIHNLPIFTNYSSLPCEKRI